MTEWREFKIKDIGTVITGTTPSSKIPEYFGTDIPFVTPTDFKYYFKYCDRTDRFLSKIGADKYKNRLLPPQSVLVTCIGSDMGKVAISKEVVITNQQINSIIVSSEFSSDFVYYSLIAIYDTLRTYGQSGTAVPIVNKTDFENITLLIPPLPEQKAIAEVLSSLDDKIDLLTRQNKTLEDLAQTYFRQRFIVEASDDWEVVRLGDILESLESGSRPKGGIDPELDDGVPSIGAESINGLGVYDFSKTKYVTKEFFNNMRRGVVKSHDVLIYKDGAYVGRKGMFGNNFPFAKFAVNEHVFILRTNEKASQIFLYFLLQEEELAQLNSNSAQPGLNQQAVNAFEIVLPPVELINDFEAFTEPLIDKIFENAKQMRTLQKLRDTLLPKLISGEVRVKQ